MSVIILGVKWSKNWSQLLRFAILWQAQTPCRSVLEESVKKGVKNDLSSQIVGCDGFEHIFGAWKVEKILTKK